MRRALLILLGLTAVPALAQNRYAANTSYEAMAQPAVTQPPQPGHLATSSAGEAGQRQRREQATQNFQPLGRIDSRIGNRVQSRIRNRLDRYYDPQANVMSPFKVAGDKARATGKPRTR